MKFGVYWSTPSHLDPNGYLRYSILNASDDRNTLMEIDPNLKISRIYSSEFDAILVIGTLLKPELYMVDFLHERKNVPVVFWDLESPYDSDLNTYWYPLFDHVFSVEKQVTFEKDVVPVSYLPLAADAFYFFSERTKNVQPHIAFVGSDYDNRIRLTNQLQSLLKRNEKIIRVGTAMTDSSDFVSRYRRLSTREISRIDSLSRVSIISGRDFDYANDFRSISAGSPGPRIFETIMSGGLPLVDEISLDKSICETLFPDLLYFSSGQQAIEVFRSISDSDRLLRTKNLQEVLFSQHLYKHRIDEISKKIRGLK
jgi:spore maturation protein CgeB